MLYLEDYLELIEHLPQELLDRFIDIRERDLQVHNSSEQLKEKVKLFFAEAKKLKPEQRQCEYEKLLAEYEETTKYAEDKVHIATQMHDVMIKLVQRLDTELEKFKLELEADHAGITEELERRSLELDADTRLGDLNGHLNGSSSRYSASGIKDRRRSEHKHQHRHHPYQNNHDNGYNHGRAKLSNDEHDPYISKHPYHNNQIRQGSKYHNHQSSVSSSRQHSAATSPAPMGLNGPPSAPASIAGDLNGMESVGGHYGNNLSSFGNNTGFKNLSIKNNSQLNNANSPFNQQHSALSAALASPQLNSVSTYAAMNSSVHNKISSNNSKSEDLLGRNNPLVRQNPLAAAASQAIAATQQLQQGRRTPSLQASFAAIKAGLGSLDNLSKHDGANRNALAPMAPDQQALRYNQQYGKLSQANSMSNQMYVSVNNSGRPTKMSRLNTSHLYPDESPTSILSDNSILENSESLSSVDYMESGTTFGSNSPSSLDFASARGNSTFYHGDDTKYCICRQISYGEMVACDNEECEIEWFHYDCVGITQPPKGKWYCPDCIRKMTNHQQNSQQTHTPKKRGRKEKSLFNLVNNPLDSVRSKERTSDQSKSIVS